VEEISLFTTNLRTPDNKTVIIPNSSITNASITNFSARPNRRLDLVVGVSYADDLKTVKAVLEGILQEDPRVLRDPAPTVGVLALGESSVDWAVRPWVATVNYWDVHFDLHQKIKERFDEAGIEIPFPQRVVHHRKDLASAVE
jgi:small conductance mechanosensitive channel